jgi:asparagine synthase (glutamine-hydrolysing)
MPIATIGERRAEKELLCKKFPELAALPLDRNTYDTQPLKPRLRHLLASYVSSRVTVFGRLVLPKHKHNVERRYYYRIYDFNSPGWVAVRNRAEAYRSRTFDFFQRDVLQELLPGSNVSLRFRDGIIDASGLKVLTGFFLWARNHL